MKRERTVDAFIEACEREGREALLDGWSGNEVAALVRAMRDAVFAVRAERPAGAADMRARAVSACMDVGASARERSLQPGRVWTGKRAAEECVDAIRALRP